MIARVQRDEPGRTSFFSGNRMFYSGYRYVICVGDPKQR